MKPSFKREVLVGVFLLLVANGLLAVTLASKDELKQDWFTSEQQDDPDTLRTQLHQAETHNAQLQLALQAVVTNKVTLSATKCRVTNYQSVVEQTDDTPDTTCINRRTRPGTCAISRDLFTKMNLAFGDILYIEGRGTFRVEDIMDARFKNAVDIWTPAGQPIPDPSHNLVVGVRLQ